MLKDKKVLVAEKIDEGAVNVLRESCQVEIGYDLTRERLLETIGDYEGIIIRSGTVIDVELLDKAERLKIVGRAGNGTDNINIPEATKRGIIVANTPESNTMSAAELSCSHILSQSRNVVKANNYIKGGQWDRNPFKGNEVYEKTLGIVGLGRIGALVAERMQGFQMKVIAYDPYISDSRFKRYKVEKKETLEALIKESDYISVHTPRNEETYHMINDDHLELMKKGVRLTNVARGGIIAEQTILKGIEEGIIESAAIDVHEEEPSFNNPLFALDEVTVTPHLGASTVEAQRNVGMNVIEQVIYALQGEIVPNALNLPTLSRSELKSTKPYITLVEKLGKMYYQLTHDTVEVVTVEYFGQLANKNNKLITLSFLKGLLDTVIDSRVNYINADLIAEQRGIIVREKTIEDYYNGYTEFVRITVKGSNEAFSFGGNLSAKNEGRLVEFNGYEIDITPDQYMYIVQNMDLPGVVGHVGTVLGETNTNVATMQLGRNQAGDQAMMILNVDNRPTDETVNKLLAVENIFWAKKVIL